MNFLFVLYRNYLNNVIRSEKRLFDRFATAQRTVVAQQQHLGNGSQTVDELLALLGFVESCDEPNKNMYYQSKFSLRVSANLYLRCICAT